MKKSFFGWICIAVTVIYVVFAVTTYKEQHRGLGFFVDTMYPLLALLSGIPGLKTDRWWIGALLLNSALLVFVFVGDPSSLWNLAFLLILAKGVIYSLYSGFSYSSMRKQRKDS